MNGYTSLCILPLQYAGGCPGCTPLLVPMSADNLFSCALSRQSRLLLPSHSLSCSLSTPAPQRVGGWSVNAYFRALSLSQPDPRRHTAHDTLNPNLNQLKAVGGNKWKERFCICLCEQIGCNVHGHHFLWKEMIRSCAHKHIPHRQKLLYLSMLTGLSNLKRT